jgi:hypothetical protein
MTKNEIIEELKAKGIEHNPRASKAELEALLPVEASNFESAKPTSEDMEASAAAIIDESKEEEEEANERMDIIGQNGNTGEHYDDEDFEDVEELVEVIATEDEDDSMSVEDFWALYEKAEGMIKDLVEESRKISNLVPLSRRLKPLSRSMGKFKRFKK